MKWFKSREGGYSSSQEISIYMKIERAPSPHIRLRSRTYQQKNCADPEINIDRCTRYDPSTSKCAVYRSWFVFQYDLKIGKESFMVRLTIPCKQIHLIVHEGTVIAIEVVSFGVPPCSIHASSSSLRRCVLKTIVDTLPGNPDRVDMPAESPAPRANPRPTRTLMSMAETPYTAGKQFRRQSVIWELKPSPAMKNSRFQVLNIYSEQVKEVRRTWQVHTHTHADIAALSTIIASAFWLSSQLP